MTLSERVATSIRAEMAGARKTNKELATILHVSPRAAMRRRNGEYPFSLNEIEKVAVWLDVPVSQLMASRALEAVAA